VSGRAAPRWAPGTAALRCVDDQRADVACSGTVELRESLTGTGTPIARCGGHWTLRLAYQRQHDRDYPDGPVPPAWFDATAAGESWDEPD
jgi:hypothetical protein